MTRPNSDEFVALALEANSVRITECGCRIWMLCVDSSGYGLISYQKKQERTHRVAWMIAHDRVIPDGMLILHRCDIPARTNPDHLFLGTQLENIADRQNKKRGKNHVMKGITNPNAVLSESDVLAIRAMSGKQREIADKYGISQPLVSGIKRKKIWRHL